MSPTEFELRAALRSGEGEGVSADRVVIAAQRRRVQRRHRLLTTAASVVVVAAVAGGVTAIARSSGSESAGPSNGGAKAAGSPAEPSAAAGERSAPGSREFGASSACPFSFPDYKLPGGGSPGQFGSGGALFSKPVAQILVCGYGSATLTSTTPLVPGALELTSVQASELVRSMENASTRVAGTACADVRYPEHRIALYATTADGTAAGTVTATFTNANCGIEITNGTAVRWDWQIPSDLQPKIVNLQPTSVVSQPSVPPGIMHGSPIAS